ncbi:hypothetical protein RFF05_09420 [Bengtsoniella intestinalis]|uniref:hypothetical protein n=1 Tax=Bengtsoniella intestinalis TaxID=3073143 RepID=UPI00391F11F7
MMGKIETLTEQINECARYIDELKNTNFITEDEIISDASEFIWCMANAYHKENNQITAATMCVNHDPVSAADCISGLKRLSAVLTAIRDNMDVAATSRRTRNSLPTPVFNIHQSNTQTQNTSIVITIEQAFEAIQTIPEDVLSGDEKDELEDKLSAVETAKNGKDKGKLAAKIGAVLKYITDKGIEVGIAVLPYLGEIAKIYNGL